MKTLDELPRYAAPKIFSQGSVKIGVSVSPTRTSNGIQVERRYSVVGDSGLEGDVFGETAFYDEERPTPDVLLGDAMANLKTLFNSSHYKVLPDDGYAIISPLEGVSASKILDLE